MNVTNIHDRIIEIQNFIINRNKFQISR